MKRRKSRYLELGEISNATLNPEHLIPRYLDEARGLRLTKPERKLVSDIERASEAEGYYDGNGEDGSANPVEDMVALGDILDAHCPPYTYFGSLEGDGACFGVWIAQESLGEGVESGEVWRQDGSKDDENAKIPGWLYRLVISDHGNMSLYHRNGREVWSAV